MAPGDPIGRALAPGLHPPARPGQSGGGPQGLPAAGQARAPHGHALRRRCGSRQPHRRRRRGAPGHRTRWRSVDGRRGCGAQRDLLRTVDPGLGHRLRLGRCRCPNVRSASYFGSYYTNNAVVTRVGADGKVKLRPSSSVGLVVDVVGWLPTTSWVKTTAPARIVDTRSGLGAPSGKVAAGGRIDVTVAGRGGIPSTGAVAAVLSVTAPKVAAVRLGGSVGDRERRVRGVADVQLTGGSTSTGLVTTLIGSTGRVSLYATTLRTSSSTSSGGCRSGRTSRCCARAGCSTPGRARSSRPAPP